MSRWSEDNQEATDEEDKPTEHDPQSVQAVLRVPAAMN